MGTGTTNRLNDRRFIGMQVIAESNCWSEGGLMDFTESRGKPDSASTWSWRQLRVNCVTPTHCLPIYPNVITIGGLLI